MEQTSLFRGVLVLLAIGFCSLIAWAFLNASFGDSFAVITTDPWGLVTLVDLYLGFILISGIIWAFEGTSVKAVLWILPTFFLGNFWPAIWLAFRLPEIVQRLRAQRG